MPRPHQGRRRGLFPNSEYAFLSISLFVEVLKVVFESGRLDGIDARGGKGHS